MYVGLKLLLSLAETFLLIFGPKFPAWYNDEKHTISAISTAGTNDKSLRFRGAFSLLSPVVTLFVE